MTKTETKSKLDLVHQMQEISKAIQSLTEQLWALDLYRNDRTPEQEAKARTQAESIAARKAELIQERNDLGAELKAPREKRHQIELSTSELETLAQLVVDYEQSPSWDRETSEKLGDIWVELVQHRRPQD